MHGLYWWVDRWRRSRAFSDMTLEEQGAYRNLLDEATLRDGGLPVNERILAKACGDARAWKRVRRAVLAKFVRKGQAWRNHTLDAVLHQSQRRIDNQRAYRARLARDNARDNGRGNGRDNKAAYQDPDPDIKKNPPTPLLKKGGRLTRQELQAATERRNRVHGGCPHHPKHSTAAACVQALALEARES